MRICKQCNSEIKEDQDKCIVHQDYHRTVSVHTACLNVFNELLFAEQETKLGPILGLCLICERPVRVKQDWNVCLPITDNGAADLTKIPSEANKIVVLYVHVGCKAPFIDDPCGSGKNTIRLSTELFIQGQDHMGRLKGASFR